MANGDTSGEELPPYIPFSTFVNFVERLKSTAIPSKIDNTVMPNLAGGVTVVRFGRPFSTRLTDSEDHVNTTFRDLVQTRGTDSSEVALATAVIDTAYHPVLNAQLTAAGATPKRLQINSKRQGVRPDAGESDPLFYTGAPESGWQAVLAHLIARGKHVFIRQRNSEECEAALRGRGNASESERRRGRGRDSPFGTGTKVRSFNFPIPGQPDIRVVVPEKLDDPDAWEMVNATLRSYIRLNAKGGEGRTNEGRGEG